MTKRGMRGFAAGLWIAAAVMAYFFYTGQDPVKTNAEPTLSKEQVQRYLSHHGQIAVKKTEYESLTAAAANPVANEQTSGNSANGEDTETNKTDKENEQKAAPTRYTLHIEKGMTSRDVAKLLEDAGIISNGDALRDYLRDHNLARKVQLGTFKLTGDMSIAEIAKQITS